MLRVGMIESEESKMRWEIPIRNLKRGRGS